MRSEPNPCYKRAVLPVLALAPVLADPPAAAVVPQQPAEPSEVQAWLRGSYATGTWRGLRTALQDHGITIDLAYTGDLFTGLSGRPSIKAAYHAASTSG